MSTTKKVNYEATVTLPSKGILYNGEVPAEISMRGMTTKEEKILYASQGGNVFHRVLKNCIVEPENLDIGKLIAADEMFLIIQLRMVTYGPEYKVPAVCPHCGKSSTYTINLGEFDVDYLPDDFEEPIKLKLPKSGDEVAIRILRNSDSEALDKYVKKYAKDFNIPIREAEYTLRLAKYIVSVNGEPMDFVSAREYVDNLASMDSMKIQTALNKIRVGVNTDAHATCELCGEDFDFAMPITSEFFRPTVE